MGTISKPAIVGNEKEFERWFRRHLAHFGYVKVLVEPTGPYTSPYPDFWCVTQDFKVERVELELLAYNFFKHEHDHALCDKIICAEDNSSLYGLTDSSIPIIEIPEVKVIPNARNQFRCCDRFEEAFRPGNLRRLGALLNWWQPPGATRCIICGQPLPIGGKGQVAPSQAAKTHSACLGPLKEKMQLYIAEKRA